MAADLPSVPRSTWVQLREGLHVHLADACDRRLVVTAEGLGLLARLGVAIALLDPADGSLCWGNDRFSRLCGRAGVVTDWGALRPAAGPLLDILEYVRANNLRVDVQAPVRTLLPGLLSPEAAEQGDDIARLHCQSVKVTGEAEDGVGSPALPYNRDLLSLQFPTFRVPGQREEEEQREDGGGSGFVQTGAGQVVALIDAAMAYRSDARDKLKDLRRRVLENRLDEPVDAPDLLTEVGLTDWRDSAALAVMLGADFSDRRRSIALPPRRRVSGDTRRRSVSTLFRG